MRYNVGSALYIRRELARSAAELKGEFQSANAAPQAIEPIAANQQGFETRTSWTEKSIDFPIPFWMALAAAPVSSVVAFLWMFRKTS